ncbi:MAG: hypothetical protein JW775_07915, partial [Candidatus Aminicenantes bacterium]|nr:hypothetical protein [Candidatus Aminicenantes bacterium]
MTRKTTRFRFPLVAACLLAAAGLALTAAGPSSAPADGKAVVLEYRMPSGRALTYRSSAEEAQIMDVMGQIIDTQTGGTSTFTFTSKGRKDKDFLLGVTIDDMTMNISSSVQG